MNKHFCHAHRCKIEVPPRLWGCKRHWYMLPKELRVNILVHYRKGQEKDKRPTPEYVRASLAATLWICQKEYPDDVLGLKETHESIITSYAKRYALCKR